MTRNKLSFFDDLFDKPLSNKSPIGNRSFESFEDSFNLDINPKSVKNNFSTKIPIVTEEDSRSDITDLTEFSEPTPTSEVSYPNPKVETGQKNDDSFFKSYEDDLVFKKDDRLPSEDDIINDHFAGFNYDSLKELPPNKPVDELSLQVDDYPFDFNNEEHSEVVSVNEDTQNSTDMIDSDILTHVQNIFDRVATIKDEKKEKPFFEQEKKNVVIVDKSSFTPEQRKAWLDFSETLNNLMN